MDKTDGEEKKRPLGLLIPIGVLVVAIILGFFLRGALGLFVFFLGLSYFAVGMADWFWKRRTFVSLREKGDTVVLEDSYKVGVSIPENMPLPYCIVDNTGKITLYNHSFGEIFYRGTVGHNSIFLMFPDIQFQINKQTLTFGKMTFVIYAKCCSSEEGDTGAYYSLCFCDVSETQFLKQQLFFQKTVVALLFLDNFEEIADTLEESRLPILTAIIDRKLNTMASSVGGVVKKFEKDRYLFLLSMEKLETLKEKKFEILNEIREINTGSHSPITISMGIGIGEDSLETAMKNARTAIDLALGRGGDQVLIKDGDKYSFFGGRSGEVSHNARVRARVKAEALWELLGESSDLYVMGHKNADLDSMGSCLGIYAICRAIGKKCHIVLDSVSPGVERLMERIHQNPSYDVHFVTGRMARSNMSDKSLIVVTDTHRHGMVECGRLVQDARRVVVIDHHRRSTDFIEKAVLVYHEPYASSTSELVAEMVRHFSDKVKLHPVEADALLAGMTVDTKNFSIKTGSITFEVAAFLKRNGADSVRVRMLLQNDMESHKAIADTVKDARLLGDCIAISICPAHLKNATVTAAQAADDLLNVVGIKASFVSCMLEDVVYISARSLGEINVQRIMEKLGGGGHMAVSGAQLQDCTMDEAQEKLKTVIFDYLKEEL